MNEVRDNKQRFRYEILVDGTLAGFVTYGMRGGRMILVHTDIDEAHEGHGLAGILVAAQTATRNGLAAKRDTRENLKKYLSRAVQLSRILHTDRISSCRATPRINV